MDDTLRDSMITDMKPENFCSDFSCGFYDVSNNTDYPLLRTPDDIPSVIAYSGQSFNYGTKESLSNVHLGGYNKYNKYIKYIQKAYIY